MSTRLSQMSGGAGESGAISSSGTDSYLRIFRYFGLRENPFNVSPDPRYLSFTRRSQEAFDAIVYGIQSRQGLIVLTGEVGTGKTTLTKYLLNWLAERQTPTAYICNPRLSFSDLLDFIFADFGITLPAKMKGDKSAMLTGWLLAQNRAGKRPVLIVDEAQGLPLQVLEQIRLLLNQETANEKLLQIILVGQPELEQTLNRAELLRLRQRIMVRCRIGSLNSHETRAYILRRLRVAGAHGESAFTPEAMESVFEYSCGIPRVINNICEHAMINAFADYVPRISAKIVKEVAKDFDLDEIKPFGTFPGLNRLQENGALALSFGADTMPKFANAAAEASVAAPEIISAEEIASPGPIRGEDLSLQHADTRPLAYSASAGDETTAEILMVEEQFATRCSRTASRVLASLNAWRGWGALSLVEYSFSQIRGAASSVVRWLAEPVDPFNPWHRNSHHPRTSGRAGQGISAT